MAFRRLYFAIVLAAILVTGVRAQFIYVNPGVFKFIVGLGLPIDAGMPGGSLSWFTNLQVFYKLPDNVTYFEPYKIMHGRSLKNTFNRANVYRALLKYSQRLGFSGGDCIHRLICEVAHRRINRAGNGLLGEIVKILFSPGKDPSGGLERYKRAQKQGLYNGTSCGNMYGDCFLRGNALVF